MTASHLANDRASDRRVEKAALEQEIRQARRAVLIVNSRSRRGARLYLEAKRQLTEAGMVLEASYPVRHAERLPQIVRAEIGRGRTFIIVGGGDGTISSVVDHFAHIDVVLGVLPLGTANSFARTLGIPLDLSGAIDVLVRGKVADVDLGKINGDYFANGASIGMPTVVGRATPHRLKKWLGRGAYLLVAAAKLMGHTSFQCTITVKAKTTSFDALDVRIANGAYQGGILVAPDANPDDGKIAVHILKGRSRRALAGKWARAVMRAPFRSTDLELLNVPGLTIDAIPAQHVAVDGEVISTTPIRVSVERDALLVMVPKRFDDCVDAGHRHPSPETTA